MKENIMPKIIRQGDTTIIIAHDPEGEFANSISADILSRERLERAKESLRRCPLPDRIVKPYLEKIRADYEKQQGMTSTDIAQQI